MNSATVTWFYSMLAIALCNSGVSTTNITFGGECEPTKQAVASDCYIVLKESLLKRDENVRKLSETFFPPQASLPEFVEVTYIFGGNR